MENNTKSFKEIIKDYLDNRAQNDPLFAKSYAKENKNIKDCCSYITSQAKKQASNGCAAILDEVVFGWAVHYFDEDDIKVITSSNTQSEVKTSAAKSEIKNETPKAKIKLKKKEDVGQYSLFDL